RAERKWWASGDCSRRDFESSQFSWTRATEYESSCRSLLFRPSRCVRRRTSSTFDAEHRGAYLFSWYGSTAMKPAPFQYVTVASIDAGVDALAEHVSDDRIIAC